jgi:eukaryotic-like serine/threonine-protein kinase
MSHRFVRCPHCKLPHEAALRVCPMTGQRLGSEVAPRQVMSELPPPSRRPEPLGFPPPPPKHDAGGPKSTSGPDTLNPTRSLRRELIGQTVGSRYVVRGILGEGGMGTVYEAEHLGLGRPVAIKVLSPAQARKRVAVKRFQQEARAAGAIGHPNICEVYDMGRLDDGSPYLVMEKLVGQTLSDRIAGEGGLPFDEITEVMLQVLGGLIAAHDKGIVHRDIKPENIFLAKRVGCPPIVKILDFGVSKMMAQFAGSEDLDLTRTGMVMGTPYYMSPEQARGQRDLDGRVDVYACGVMMYEAIAGKRPFIAPNYNALLLSIINVTPKPLRDVRPATPPALEAIVVRAMSKVREERYPSASRFLTDVQALATVSGRVPPPPTIEERMRAPVLGGAPSSRSPRALQSRAAAVLKGGLADAKHYSAPATRLDIKVQSVARAAPSDSVEIPLSITGSEVGAPGEYADDMPTAVFRPERHRPPKPLTGSATRVGPPLAPRLPLPPEGDEWEGETVVTMPPELSKKAPGAVDFNSEETVALEGKSVEVDLDFADETRVMIPPPKRR